MFSYFYKFTPFVIIFALFILALPWLGLVALMVVALVVLPAIAWVIAYVPYRLGRSLSRVWHGYDRGDPQPAVPLSVATRESAFREGPSL